MKSDNSLNSLNKVTFIRYYIPNICIYLPKYIGLLIKTTVESKKCKLLDLHIYINIYHINSENLIHYLIKNIYVNRSTRMEVVTLSYRL